MRITTIIKFLFFLCISSAIQAQPFGTAISLDGANDYIEIPNSPNTNVSANLTLEAWIKPCDVNGHQAIMSKIWCNGNKNSYYFSIKDGFLRFVWFNDNCGVPNSTNSYESNSAVIQPNVWQHVAVVHTSSSITLYLNGLPVAASLLQGSYGNLRTNTEPIRIGTYINLAGNNTLQFGGLMDEARIWNVAVSPSDIFLNHDTTLVGNETGLMAYYQMDRSMLNQNSVTVNASTNTGAVLNGTIKSNLAPSFYYFDENGSSVLGPDTTNCGLSAIPLVVPIPAQSYLWSDGSTFNTFSATQTGSYWVTYTTSCDTYTDTIFVQFDSALNFSLGPDTVLCNTDSFALKADQSLSQYTWSNGSHADSLTINAPGNYWLSSSNSCGTYTDSINVQITNFIPIDLGPDTVICKGDTIPFRFQTTNSSYLWSDGSTSSNFFITDSGTYWVELSTSCGISSDTLAVTLDSLPIIDLGPDTTICAFDTVQLHAQTPSGSYLWNTGSINSSIQVTQEGTYSVQVHHTCGILEDSITINTLNAPNASLGPDTTLCIGDSLLLSNNNSANSYTWSTGISDTSIWISQNQTVWIITQNHCGTDSDTINISFIAPPIFSLGPDTTFYPGLTLNPRYSNQGADYLWNTGTSDSSLLVTDAGTYWVQINIGGCFKTDSIVISNSEEPELGNVIFPNIFTPNNDGINDILTLDTYPGMERLYFEVFNRWGQKVFESNFVQIQWDGTNFTGQKQPTGTYYFIAHIEDTKGQKLIVKGSIQLSR